MVSAADLAASELILSFKTLSSASRIFFLLPNSSGVSPSNSVRSEVKPLYSSLVFLNISILALYSLSYLSCFFGLRNCFKEGSLSSKISEQVFFPNSNSKTSIAAKVKSSKALLRMSTGSTSNKHDSPEGTISSPSPSP